MQGFAYVEFGSKEALDAALGKSGTFLNGRHIDVSESRPQGGGAGVGGRGGGRDGGRGGRGGGHGGRPPAVHDDTPLPTQHTRMEPAGVKAAVGMGFLPRALVKAKAPAAASDGVRKSNADFRAMMLAKK